MGIAMVHEYLLVPCHTYLHCATAHQPTTAGQGELAGVKTQLLEIIYFWKFDTNFCFKSMKLALGNSISNQQAQK
jgi:hypothetical protein